MKAMNAIILKSVVLARAVIPGAMLMLTAAPAHAGPFCDFAHKICDSVPAKTWSWMAIAYGKCVDIAERDVCARERAGNRAEAEYNAHRLKRIIKKYRAEVLERQRERQS